MIRTRTWILLMGIVLAVCLVSVILMQTGGTDGEVTAVIYLDNKPIHRVQLSGIDEPYTIPVTGENGTNIISVEPGRICVMEADCPDQICVNQGWQSDGITPIVCLPNKLVIQFERQETAENEGELDGVIQ